MQEGEEHCIVPSPKLTIRARGPAAAAGGTFAGNRGAH